MAETILGKKVFSLSEVSQSIQRTLRQRYTSSFWVKAEMNKLNYYSHSGHCYPEILEKADGKVIALMKAVLWKNDFERINALFINALNEPLRDGISVLINASVVYDSVHGLSLKINDIDPWFSLGELEREKIQTIEKLNKEGIFDSNKTLEFPVLPRRIAIISVETSKGFADFQQIIDKNTFGYRFFYFLFPALLQGEKAVDSIINQLNRVRKVSHHFDLVAIIRGGGGDVGLSCYNHYRLAREVALFPLPVISGIGHATNETVTEMVSYKHFITPTEAAGFLLQSFHDFAVPLKKHAEKIRLHAIQSLIKKKSELFHAARYFRLAVNGSLQYSHQHLLHDSARINQGLKAYFQFKTREIINQSTLLLQSAKQHAEREKSKLDSTERFLDMLDPAKVLSRGYSITRFRGSPLLKSSELEKGDILETILFSGSLISKVEETNHENE